MSEQERSPLVSHDSIQAFRPPERSEQIQATLSPVFFFFFFLLFSSLLINQESFPPLQNQKQQLQSKGHRAVLPPLPTRMSSGQ